jgi:hypothetical protein
MKSIILALVLAAAPVAASAQHCIRGEVQRDGSIVYPELGPRCPGDDPRSRPTRDQREAAERQFFAASMERRQAAQGVAVHRMSLDRCETLLQSVPRGVAPLGPLWHPGQPSPDNPYMTPQENWCRALTRAQSSPADNRYPGMLPDGWHATYLGNGRWRVSP